MFSRSCVRAASVCHGYKLPSHHLNGQGEWRITGGCSMGQETCTCFGLELTPESMPGWPISKKKRKDPVPSTNDGCSGKEGWWFFFFNVFLSLSSLPPRVPLFLSNSVNLVSTAKLCRNTQWGLQEWEQWLSRVVCACVSVCVYACMCGYVCVCVCLTCLWNKNVLVCPKTDIWLCPIGYRGLQTLSLPLHTGPQCFTPPG